MFIGNRVHCIPGEPRQVVTAGNWSAGGRASISSYATLWWKEVLLAPPTLPWLYCRCKWSATINWWLSGYHSTAHGLHSSDRQYSIRYQLRLTLCYCLLAGRRMDDDFYNWNLSITQTKSWCPLGLHARYFGPTLFSALFSYSDSPAAAS